MLRAGLYARVSTNDQQTLAMQNRAMRGYAARRGWTIALQVREVNSGRHDGKPARHCWKPPAGERSIWCWCGGWIAGDGQSRTCWRRSRNWSIWVSGLFP